MGYNSTEKTYKIKGTYGSAWGENGYFRLAQGTEVHYSSNSGYNPKSTCSLIKNGLFLG